MIINEVLYDTFLSKELVVFTTSRLYVITKLSNTHFIQVQLFRYSSTLRFLLHL